MLNYANQKIIFNGCPACAYKNHEFELPCGMAYENDYFTLSQDWELPIVGFFIVSPKRHIEKLEELSNDERNEMFDIVNETIKVLRENDICDRFDFIFEEKENRHFHIWIMPRHKWMKELNSSIIDNIGIIFDYAKSHFRNKNTYEEINETTNILKEHFNKKIYNKQR